VSKRGLPSGVKMRHDSHYVEDLTRTQRTVGRTLPIDKLIPNPEQPRVEIGDLAELSSSIKQKGVLEPILVKPNSETGTWMIIAGERRWRAANLAGLEEVPCIELDLDEQSIAEIALIENLQRKDLTIWEVADGLAFLSEKFDYTHEDIAKKIGKSRTTVTESLTISGIPNSIREKCRDAEINSKSILLEIARQFDEAAMHEFVDKISGENLSRKEIRQKARPKIEKQDSVKKNLPDKTKSPQENIFIFYSAKNNFKLEIVFDGFEFFDNKIVLKALKEAFDKVKAES
jgi:ParB family chromosome partitioning protein